MDYEPIILGLGPDWGNPSRKDGNPPALLQFWRGRAECLPFCGEGKKDGICPPHRPKPIHSAIAVSFEYLVYHNGIKIV